MRRASGCVAQALSLISRDAFIACDSIRGKDAIVIAVIYDGWEWGKVGEVLRADVGTGLWSAHEGATGQFSALDCT